MGSELSGVPQEATITVGLLRLTDSFGLSALESKAGKVRLDRSEGVGC